MWFIWQKRTQAVEENRNSSDFRDFLEEPHLSYPQLITVLLSISADVALTGHSWGLSTSKHIHGMFCVLWAFSLWPRLVAFSTYDNFMAPKLLSTNHYLFCHNFSVIVLAMRLGEPGIMCIVVRCHRTKCWIHLFFLKKLIWQYTFQN